MSVSFKVVGGVKLIKIIEDINKAVFDYDIDTLMQHINQLIDNLSKIMLNMEDSGEFQQILQYMMNALENKDYLLLADLLQYELSSYLVNS